MLASIWEKWEDLKLKQTVLFSTRSRHEVCHDLCRRAPIPFPTLPVPGGNMVYEDRKLLGHLGDSLKASVQCQSFLHPSDDINLNIGYRRAAIFCRHRNNEIVKTAAFDLLSSRWALFSDVFNTKRLSSVFTSPNSDLTVPTVYVERFGTRTGFDAYLNRNSRANINLVAQQVKMREDQGNSLVAHGSKLVQQRPVPGPPTTLSDSGCDRSIHLQMGLLRDTALLHSGNLVGARDKLQVDQGLGLGNGIFNRCVLGLDAFTSVRLPHIACRRSPAESGAAHVRRLLQLHGCARCRLFHHLLA